MPTSTIAQPLVLTDAQTSLPASSFVSLLEDPTHSLQIAQVSATEYTERFQPNTQQHINLGRSKSAWWLRLEITQQNSNIWHLLFNFPGIAHADAFAVNHTTQHIQSLGSLLREYAWQRLPTVTLPNQPGSYSLYIRVSNEGMGILSIPIQLLSTDALSEKIAQDYLFYGGTITGLIVLALYNLFLLSSLRNWDYLTLVIFLLSLALVLQRCTNVIPYLSPLSNPVTLYYPIAFQITIISATQFCRRIIGTTILFPRTDQVIKAIMILAIGTTPFTSLLPYTDLWSFTLSTVLILIGSVLGVLSLRKGSRIVRSFAASFFVLLGSAAPLVIWGIGFLKDTPTTALIDLFNIGSLLTAILLSLTLAEHTRQLRIQAERATAESQAKDDFLITMSHELRTPMNSLIASTTLLQQDKLPPHQREYVKRMETASHHILGLINNILDLAQITHATLTLHHTPFHLPTLLNHIQQILSTPADAKQLVLSISPPAQADLYLLGDSKRLSQVLINLLGNAIKFTEQGKVALAIKSHQTSYNSTISLYFEITDTGIGIHQQEQHRLFQPFTQIESHQARRYDGSGLGLAISHKLIDAMGGTLAMDSELGKGSRFFFTLEFPLPSCRDVLHTPSPLPSQTASLIGKHILLVDDDEMNQFFGQKLLQTLGVTVSIAASGAETIQQLQQQPFDLVLMDVSMPEMNGYETTQRIRSDPRFTLLPIIALTAHAISGERERCLTSGMNDYLTKPFDLEQIHEMIYQWTASTP